MKGVMVWMFLRRVCAALFLAPAPTGQRHRIFSVLLVVVASVLAGWGMNAFEPGLQSVADTRSQAKLARIAVKSTNPCVRRAAVAKLANQPLLYRIALEDEDLEVRQTAAASLIDPALLARYLKQSRDLRSCAGVVRKITNQTHMAQFVLALDESNIREGRSEDNYLAYQVVSIVESITNQWVLTKLALNASPSLGCLAVRNLTDLNLLSNVVVASKEGRVRVRVAAKLQDQTLLAKIAMEAQDASDRNSYRIRSMAVYELTDQGLLAKIAMDVKYTKDIEMMRIGMQAAEKITNEVRLAEMGMWVRPEWTRKVTDQALLARLARESVNGEVRDAALEKLTRPDLLASLAISAPDDYIRHDAMDKLRQQKWLEQVAVEATDSEIRATAVGCLTNLELLAKIAVSDQREAIRKFAARQAADLRTAASNELNRAGQPSRISTNGIPADVTLGLDLF